MNDRDDELRDENHVLEDGWRDDDKLESELRTSYVGRRKQLESVCVVCKRSISTWFHHNDSFVCNRCAWEKIDAALKAREVRCCRCNKYLWLAATPEHSKTFICSNCSRKGYIKNE
jgi:hypothetical protein